MRLIDFHIYMLRLSWQGRQFRMSAFPAKNVHNLLFVATEHDSIHASELIVTVESEFPNETGCDKIAQASNGLLPESVAARYKESK